MVRLPLIVTTLEPVKLVSPVDVQFISTFPYVLPANEGAPVPASAKIKLLPV